jgi:adhesin transport system outer membrane protein
MLLLACGVPRGVDAQVPPGLAAFTERAVAALAAHPEVAAREQAFRAQASAFEASKAAGRPRLDLGASVGTERSPAIASDGSSSSYSGSSRRATVIGRQLLYDGGGVDAETERQGQLANVLLHELRASENTVLLELARAWIDVRRQRALVALAADVVESHERVAALVGIRVGSGVARPVDLDQTRARLASARLSREAEEAALAEALARWRRASPAAFPFDVAEFEVPAAWLPATEAEALAEAMAHAPSAFATLSAVSVLAAELRVRRSAYSPRVALEARHDLAAQTPAYRDAAASSLLLTLNLNLFAGWGDANREAETERRLESARQVHRDALLALRQSVATGWAETLRQGRSLYSASDYAASIARARDLYLAQYELAQRSLLDVLNAENELAQARRLEINTRADRVLAQLRLLSTLGRLPERMGLARRPALPLVPVAEPEPLSLAGIAPTTARSLLGPDVPEPMRAAVVAWIEALERARPRGLGPWHVGAPDPVWIAAERPKVLAIERIDAVSAQARGVQLSVLVRDAGAAAGTRCLSGTQLWRDGRDGAWRIERERVITAPAERCVAAGADR